MELEYTYFINMVKQYETDRIKAFAGSQCSATYRIPSPFALLMQDIVKVLHDNIEQLCDDDEGIVIFGLQPAATMVCSSVAESLNRCYDRNQRDKHLCCTLDYSKLKRQEIYNVHKWQHSHSLVIDFTLGTIMDARAYLHQLMLQGSAGTVYGELNADTLSIAWQMLCMTRQSEYRFRMPVAA